MELIAALLHRPKVLFLDEPTIGLDVMSQKKVREFLREYNARYKVVTLLTSHYMQDIEALCERVILIDHGKIFFDGSLEEVVSRFTSTKIIEADFSAPLPADFVPPGKVLGVYGAVGSGKSTLVSLLARLHLAPPGTIALDGVDLLDVARDDLRRAVAVVPQDAFLFSRSVRENIGYIDRAADIDEARVQTAIDRACLRGDIGRLPQGLDTVVGERGQTLSGGQRQRVQLARAFYRGYRLLILDDVLSAVDHDTEAKLLAAIQTDIAAKGTSAILISHRLSALAAADEIIVLEAGKVVEQGSHSALLALGGTYARVWSAQSAEETEDSAASEG